MYMDDVKLFAKNENELETQIYAVRIYIQDIGMEFVKEKCALLVMKSDKWHKAEGMELPKKTRLEGSEKSKLTNTWVSWRLTLSNKWIWKTKLRKNISAEPESYSRQNHIAEILAKEQIPGLYSLSEIRDRFWSGPQKNLSKLTREQIN